MSAISVSWLDVSWGAVFFETNYGLMQHSFIEIKERLLKALDSEYNVVDMATVFDVVAVLERTPITPEILESTRLGKVINECRRRTNNEALARRAKLLVRRWREMMVVGSGAPPSAAATPNPGTPAALSTTPPVPHQNGTNLRSPNMAVARVGCASAAISPSSRSDRVPRATSVSPALSSSGAGRHYGSNNNNNNNNNNGNNNNNSINSYSSCSGGKSSSGGVYTGSANLVSPSSSAASSRSPLRDPKVESVPKTHVANKRLRKNASSATTTSLSPEPPTKVAKMNGAMFAGQQMAHHQQPQHYHNIHSHHHHLLQQQQQQQQQTDTERLLSPPSTFGSAAYSAVAERLGDDASLIAIVTADGEDDDDRSLAAPLGVGVNAVDLRHREPAAVTIPEPEPDPPPPTTTSASSSSSKKRNRKKANKKKLSEEDIVREKLQALSKTGRVKTTEELVAELKSLNEGRLADGDGGATNATEVAADVVVGSSAAGTTVKPSLSNSSCYVNDSSSRQQQHQSQTGDDDSCGAAATSGGGSGRLPLLECLDAEARVEREIADILARLPPLDPAQIRWGETPPPPSPPTSPAPPPTDDQVDRYLAQRWDGVNGCVTHGLPANAEDDGFREWHEMVARRTLNDDLIHILPYSIVD